MQATNEIDTLINQQTDLFSSLSNEVHELTHLVLSFLSISDLSSCQLVCKKWKKISDAPETWIEVCKNTLGLDINSKQDCKNILASNCEVHSLEELTNIINRLFELSKKDKAFAIQYQSNSNPDGKFCLIVTPDKNHYYEEKEKVLPAIKIIKNIKGHDADPSRLYKGDLHTRIYKSYINFEAFNINTQKYFTILSEIKNQEYKSLNEFFHTSN